MLSCVVKRFRKTAHSYTNAGHATLVGHAAATGPKQAHNCSVDAQIGETAQWCAGCTQLFQTEEPVASVGDLNGVHSWGNWRR